MTGILAYHPVVAVLAFLAFLGCVLAFLAVAHLKMKAERVWRHEDSYCECSHDFYAHMHHENEQPCTELMCSCQKWRERKENP